MKKSSAALIKVVWHIERIACFAIISCMGIVFALFLVRKLFFKGLSDTLLYQSEKITIFFSMVFVVFEYIVSFIVKEKILVQERRKNALTLFLCCVGFVGIIALYSTYGKGGVMLVILEVTLVCIGAYAIKAARFFF